MGYTEILQELLRPMGVYLVDTGASGAELHALGSGIDWSAENAKLTERECVVQTATDWGLEMYEDMFPRVPRYMDLNTRRGAVMALLQVNDASFTLSGINATLAGCGINAFASEGALPQTVNVTFPDVRGIPKHFDIMAEIIESILPCHLGIEYIFTFLTWKRLEEIFPKWTNIVNMTWEELEVS